MINNNKNKKSIKTWPDHTSRMQKKTIKNIKRTVFDQKLEKIVFFYFKLQIPNFKSNPNFNQ